MSLVGASSNGAEATGARSGASAGAAVTDRAEETLAGVVLTTFAGVVLTTFVGMADPLEGLTGVPFTDAGLLPALLFFLFFEWRRIEVRSKCWRRNSASASRSASSMLVVVMMATPEKFWQK